jgi:hypothetical protein
MNELDLQFQYGQMFNVAQELETRLVSECDYADDAKNNFDAFLEYTRQLGFKMPADEDPYFDFWNSVYNIIERAITQYQSDD